MKIPTPSELELLHILWKKREAKVQEINDILNKSKASGYTTTLKLMQLMYQKELVGRRLEGKGHVYFPLVEEGKTKGSLLSRFVESTFGGSSASLVTQLLGNKKVTKKEIEEIRHYLDQLENKKDGPTQ